LELSTRWIKIFKDIWDHKTRSLLVILSIAVGVAAVGMINNAKSMIERDLFGPYMAGNPALVQIYVSGFDDSLTNAVAGMREVQTVQARRTTAATIYQPNGVSRDISLMTVPDFADIKINRLPVEQGTGVPGVREILLERQSASGMGVKLGDTVTVEIDNQRRYELTVTGILHDIYVRPFTLGKQASGYVSMSTLQWMGLKPYYNRLDLVTTTDKFNRAHVLDVAGLARDRVIQPAGYTVNRIQIPGYSSDQWPAAGIASHGHPRDFSDGRSGGQHHFRDSFAADQADRHHAFGGRGAPPVDRHVPAECAYFKRDRPADRFAVGAAGRDRIGESGRELLELHHHGLRSPGARRDFAGGRWIDHADRRGAVSDHFRHAHFRVRCDLRIWVEQ
jgi:hypothetical protein